MKKLAPLLLLIILFAAAAWYFLIRKPDPVHEALSSDTTPAITVETQQAEAESRPVDVVGYIDPDPVTLPDPLPPLDQSDTRFKADIAEVVGIDPLDEYLVRDQVISRVVAMIDSLTSRQIPVQVNPVKAADGIFIVETQGDRIIMSAENFARYDGYVALIQNLDTKELMKVYRRHYPLFQAAWRQNGGEGTFRKRLIEVIDNLLETPEVPGPVYLTKPEAFYLFEAPELEAMSAGQKILVRMGSANASVVKDKLREIKSILTP